MSILVPLLGVLYLQAEPTRKEEPPPKPTVVVVVKLVDGKFDAVPPRDGTATLVPDGRGAKEAVTAPIRAGRFEFTFPDDRSWEVQRLEFGELRVRFGLFFLDREKAGREIELRAFALTPLVLHVVAAETGEELGDVELLSKPLPFLPSRPLASGRVRGADGATEGRLLSPVTIQPDEKSVSGGEERLWVKVAGRITEAVSVQWPETEMKVALTRSAGFTVRIENFAMPEVARPADLEEEAFLLTLRPHVAVREFKASGERFGSSGLGSKEEVEQIEKLFGQTAPDSIREAARADFLAVMRLVGIGALNDRREPAAPFPLDADGRAKVDEMKPGRYLVTLEVHRPFDSSLDNVVHRMEWMMMDGRPLAAALFEFRGTDGEEVVLRAPPPFSEEPGSARVRYVDATTGSALAIPLEKVRGGSLRPPPELKVADFRAESKKRSVTIRRDGDDLVVEGLVGFAALAETWLEPPWYLPLESFLELRPAAVDAAVPEVPLTIPVERATGVAIRWRHSVDALGPIDAAMLQRIARIEQIQVVDAEGRRCEAYHRDGMSLFLVPGGGRCTLEVNPRAELQVPHAVLAGIEGGTITPDGATFDVVAHQVREATASLRFE